MLGGVTDLQGTLAAVANGGTFTVAGSTFQNDGMLVAANHDHLLVTSAISDGTGVIEVGGSAVARFTAAIDAGQTLVFTDGTGTLQLAVGIRAASAERLPISTAATRSTWLA